MISKELSATLGFAVREAKKRRHEYVSVEHVLFAILHDDDGVETEAASAFYDFCHPVYIYHPFFEFGIVIVKLVHQDLFNLLLLSYSN